MQERDQVPDSIFSRFAGVTDVEYEGSEEFPRYHKILLSVSLQLKNPPADDLETVAPRALEQWIKLSLAETFKNQLPDQSSPTSPIKTNPLSPETPE